ncbi:MAG: two pore domain potassium channel family protein [Candidatus Obscuribacterales bacterium]|nr:two pore domain potassium channel family protein [Steroidobacteraceae bacterium]
MNNPSLNWRALASRHPSAFLLAAQLFSLVLYAAFDGNPSGRAVLGTFGVLVLALVIWVLKRSPTIWWGTRILAITSFTLSLSSVLIVSTTLLMWASAMEAVLYFYCAGSLIAYMMEDTRVTTDELFAAGATFTLLAWGFAYAFLVCETWIPGSFNGSDQPHTLTFFELLYASFNNLSSTGNGDIVAINAQARVLVMLEQFTGIAYIAVVVSRLIGMTIVLHRDKDISGQKK